jgi:putative PIN family toxin of toxin-antitoxin system
MHYYAVIDTNVLVSAMLKFQSVPWQIANEALLGDLIPLLCDEIVEEYREVLARPKFKLDQRAVEEFIEGMIDRGIFVDAVSVDEIIPDPKDVIFYEVIMEGRKEHDDAYLVTGNIKHFPIKSFVVTPKEMLDIMYNHIE